MKLFLISFVLIFSAPSFSALMSVKNSMWGEGNLTLDLDNNLYWLDLDLTFGISPNAASAKLLENFRYATSDELQNLLISAGLTTLSLDEEVITSDPAETEIHRNVSNFANMFGMQDGRLGFNCVTGYVLDENQKFDIFDVCSLDDYSQYALYNYDLLGSEGLVDGGVPNPNIATLLVLKANYPIDEPPTIFLLLLSICFTFRILKLRYQNF